MNDPEKRGRGRPSLSAAFIDDITQAAALMKRINAKALMARMDDSTLRSASLEPRGSGIGDPTGNSASRQADHPRPNKDLSRMAGEAREIRKGLEAIADFQALAVDDESKRGPCWVCGRGGMAQYLNRVGECGGCDKAAGRAMRKNPELTREQWRYDRRAEVDKRANELREAMRQREIRKAG